MRALGGKLERASLVLVLGWLGYGCGSSPAVAPDAGSVDGPPPPSVWTGPLVGMVTSGGQPVEGAIVRFGGRPESVVTSAEGRFELTVKDPPVPLREIALTAGKVGFFNKGIEVLDPRLPQRLELERVAVVDNPNYEFKSPDAFDAAPHCRHCHSMHLETWKRSAHAGAARNPNLHDVYNGTASGFRDEASCRAAGGAWREGQAPGAPVRVKKCYVPEGGVLDTLNAARCGGEGRPTCDDPEAAPEARPTQTGRCADCHAPASREHLPGATNLNRVRGIAYEKGIHCDFCHKIQEVLVNERPGRDGAIRMLRPGPAGRTGFSEPETMFGPHSDSTVIIMGAIYAPQFARSEFCSACHQWSEPGFRPEDVPHVSRTKWPAGLPIQDTYFEWTQSQAAQRGLECQHCHLPAATEKTETFEFKGLTPVPSGVMGWYRPYGDVRQHLFAGRLPPAPAGYTAAPGDPTRESLRDPVKVDVTAQRSGAQLDVTVRLTNEGAGHSIPTGSPMRQLVLLVEAEAKGEPLRATGGHTVPAWAGSLAEERLGPGRAQLVGKTLRAPPGASWPAAVKEAWVRFVNPTGLFDDYPALRWFGVPGRTPKEKGMELHQPLGVAKIQAVSGGELTLDRDLGPIADGALALVGDAATVGALAVDSERPTAALAGAPGTLFAKRTQDRDGALDVPFFRAVEFRSDNRLPPGKPATTQHSFDAAAAAGARITVRVTLLYRRYPLSLARARGWEAKDAVRAQRTLEVDP
ncbi:MAG: hypothetical protein IT371_11475 [Deltaproteobacteria bacterium]|nr:hypothetical protein [Deltaproteobacteria bacterium]